MDKNDPFNHSGGQEGEHHGDEHEFIDEARYDDANAPEVREAEYAAGQEEWDQPIDEFAEEEPHEGAAQPEQKHDPFADEGPVEDEFSEHAHEEHAEEQGEHSEAPRSTASSMAGMKPPSSIMKYVPIVGGGVAALVIAFFGYQHFFGDSSAPSTPPSLENQNTWDTASANPAPKHNTQQAANEFQQPAQPNEAPAQPNNMITPTAAQAQNAQAPLPQADTPPTQAAQPSAQQPQQASNPLEARISELTQQLDAMKQTQDQLNQKLQAATATPPSMDESSKAAQHALEDRIAQLEQKLSNASSSSSASTSSSSLDMPSGKASGKASRKSSKHMAPAASDQADADAALSDRPTTRHSKKASTDFMAAKKSRHSKRHSRAEANSTSGTEGFSPINSQPFQGWILRSAQPGSAWLSQGPYSSDLRRVVPGDKVQGLGTVTAIRQVAGRWIVEGTQGAVR